MGVIQAINDSLSGLVNYVTGTGTSRDKAMAASWQFRHTDPRQLLEVYRSSWIARKMISIPIDDMLREGWTWNAEGDDTTKLEEEEKRLDFKRLLTKALVRDSLYGGAALVVGHASNSEDELKPEMVSQGGLDYLLVVGPEELVIKDVQKDPAKGYGEPTMFQLSTGTSTLVNIHPSRVITLIGNPVPSTSSLAEQSTFWGDSRLSSVLRDIAAAESGIIGVGRLMDELAVAIHKIAGFNEALATVEGEDQVRRTLALINRMKSSINAVPVDTEDDYSVITASFAGIPDAIRALMQNVSGSADIPYTRFVGASPDGMNATGESDIRNYYDRLAGERGDYLEPQIAKLDLFLIRSALGRDDKDVYRKWNPLWQLNETEQLDIDTKKMTMFVEMKNSMLVHDHVVEQVVRTTMINSPNFPGAETAFDEADKMPEPDPVEVESAVSLQAGGGQPLAAAGGSSPRPRVVGGTDVGDEQPRVPAGSPRGGQWTKVAGSGGTFTSVQGGVGEDEKYAVSDYMEYAADLNDGLRKGKLERRFEDQVEELDSLIGKSKLNADMDLFRGLTPDAVEALKLEKGKIVQDLAFVSTSRSQKRAAEFSENVNGEMGYTMRIFARKGSKAADISAISGDDFEQEILLPRGSKFKVMSVNPERKQVYVHLVG